MIITICGHSRVSNSDIIREWLERILDHFSRENEITFYLGGCGEFDRMAASAVRRKKRQNPSWKSVLVLPYLNRKYDEDPYDYTLFPPIESVPPKFAILKRNEWMVTQSDVVIAYVTHSWGGAAKTLEFAQRKKKRIIQYPTGISATITNGKSEIPAAPR